MNANQETNIDLPSGTRINKYTIGTKLGGGGFGIVYRATKTGTGEIFAIKEFFPRRFVVRVGCDVVPRQGSERDFLEWKDKFKKECFILHQCRHPGIIRVFDVFEANRTSYMVMEFVKGSTLKDFVKKHGKPIDEKRLSDMIFHILEGLSHIHSKDLVHRDIKPDNIYITEKGSPLLLDFGAARYTIGEETQSLTSVLTPGFAPFEQYQDSAKSAQGPWTDIYALSATILVAMTGVTPPDSPSRIFSSRSSFSNKFKKHFSEDFIFALEKMAASETNRFLIPKGRAYDLEGLVSNYSIKFLQAVDWGFRVNASDRPKNNKQWWESFRRAEKEGPTPRDRQFRPPHAPKRFLIVPLATLGLLISMAVCALIFPPIIPDGGNNEVVLPAPNSNFRNSEGQEFVRLPGIKHLMATREVRRSEFAKFARQKFFTQDIRTNPVHIKTSGTWEPGNNATWEVGLPFIQNDDHPVAGLNWYDCKAYIDWLNETESIARKTFGPNTRYRLPKDHEWSIAVGLSDEGGDSPADRQRFDANFLWRNPGEINRYAVRKQATVSVSFGPKNDFGIFNLVGNVAEWLDDDYAPGEKPKTIRGGAFLEMGGSTSHYSLKYRHLNNPEYRDMTQGFRLMINVE